MSVAMYLRKSRAEEFSDTVDETLKRHKEALSEYAEKNGLTVSGIYEEVVSGESLFARPQMLKLLEDVEKRSYDAVLCMDIDRLGRGAMSDQGVILETLKSADTKIITPRKIYDLNNEMDETYSEFETFLARQELKTIKRRMQRGIRKTIEDGGYIANAPYGYVKVTVNKRPTLAICEDEARFVRTIFDLYVNKGIGCQQIADTINAMGAKPHRANEFGRTSVMKILRNQTYIGKIVWNQKTHIRKGTKGNQKHITISNPKEKWIIAEGMHPPIIDLILFERAQEICSVRSHPPANNGAVENPLAGLIYCAHCGALLQRQAIRGGGAYLVCHKRGCMVSSSMELVESAVLQELEPNLRQISLEQKNPANRTVSNGILNTIEVNRKTIQFQIEKLHDLLEQGIYDNNTFIERQSILNKKIVNLEHAKNRITIDSNNNSNFLSNEIQSAFSLYQLFDAGGKNLILKSVIDKIIYCKEKGSKPAQFSLNIYLKPLFPSTL
jgi:site-specific DNA recombinase